MNNDTLPNFTQIENETREELAEVKYVDISDDEQTFMDDNVTVQDVQFLHEEPAQVFKFSPLNLASREECGPL